VRSSRSCRLCRSVMGRLGAVFASFGGGGFGEVIGPRVTDERWYPRSSRGRRGRRRAFAPVAQLDRAMAFEAMGRPFESDRAYW
jgi:hypothetical protein